MSKKWKVFLMATTASMICSPIVTLSSCNTMQSANITITNADASATVSLQETTIERGKQFETTVEFTNIENKSFVIESIKMGSKELIEHVDWDSQVINETSWKLTIYPIQDNLSNITINTNYKKSFKVKLIDAPFTEFETISDTECVEGKAFSATIRAPILKDYILNLDYILCGSKLLALNEEWQYSQISDETIQFQIFDNVINDDLSIYTRLIPKTGQELIYVNLMQAGNESNSRDVRLESEFIDPRENSVVQISYPSNFEHFIIEKIEGWTVDSAGKKKSVNIGIDDPVDNIWWEEDKDDTSIEGQKLKIIHFNLSNLYEEFQDVFPYKLDITWNNIENPTEDDYISVKVSCDEEIDIELSSSKILRKTSSELVISYVPPNGEYDYEIDVEEIKIKYGFIKTVNDTKYKSHSIDNNLYITLNPEIVVKDDDEREFGIQIKVKYQKVNFETASWQNIAYYSKQGWEALKNKYQPENNTFVGLKKTVKIDGTENQVVVIDENVDEDNNGNKVPLTFMFVDLLTVSKNKDRITDSSWLRDCLVSNIGDPALYDSWNNSSVYRVLTDQKNANSVYSRLTYYLGEGVMRQAKVNSLSYIDGKINSVNSYEYVTVPSVAQIFSKESITESEDIQKIYLSETTNGVQYKYFQNNIITNIDYKNPKEDDPSTLFLIGLQKPAYGDEKENIEASAMWLRSLDPINTTTGDTHLMFQNGGAAVHSTFTYHSSLARALRPIFFI